MVFLMSLLARALSPAGPMRSRPSVKPGCKRRARSACISSLAGRAIASEEVAMDATRRAWMSVLNECISSGKDCSWKGRLQNEAGLGS